jgi:hypothetical protein
MSSAAGRSTRWLLYSALFSLIPLALIAVYFGASGDAQPILRTIERGDMLVVAATLSGAASGEYTPSITESLIYRVDIMRWIALVIAVLSAGLFAISIAVSGPLPQIVPVSIILYLGALTSGVGLIADSA